MRLRMRQGAGFVPVLVALTLAGGLGIDTREAEADPLLTLPFSAPVAECKYFCDACGEGKHKIIQAVTRNAASSHLETCNPETCSRHACATEVAAGEQLEGLWFAVREAEGEELHGVLRRYREIAYYNAERDAVQVKGCEGLVMANIPLSAEQVALLEE